jgi:surface polysaccharide O-acyltransferase-like enzyme
MSTERILAIDYIRGIAMLGVVGIHTGSMSLSNPHVNIHLFALLEIVSRFSVPIFFFVSAFGLFLSQDLSIPFAYTTYVKRRLRSVFIPYIVWSLLYMIHATLLSGDWTIWHISILIQYLFFGLASYQLYWLVILLWFYLFMPLWRWMLKGILTHPLSTLPTLLLMQIVFNYYSSYLIVTTEHSHSLVDLLLQYRLNYWVLHYVFIFLFGGYCAQNYQEIKQWLRHSKILIVAFFISTLVLMLFFYYFLLFGLHYTPEQAVNTAHQLSPIGILYTFASTLFLLLCFQSYSLPKPAANLLRALSTHSYAVYLVHPFFLYYLNELLGRLNLLFTAPVTIGFYVVVIMLSLTFGRGVKALSRPYPFIGLLLTGSRK